MQGYAIAFRILNNSHVPIIISYYHLFLNYIAATCLYLI